MAPVTGAFRIPEAAASLSVRISFSAQSGAAYIMPPIPPIPPAGIAGAAGASSLMSTIPASVVSSIADADAAF